MKYQRFARRRAEDASSAEPHENLIALRLVLLLAAGRAWGAADLSWTDYALRIVSALEPCEGEELEVSSGSLAALALAVIDYEYVVSVTSVDRGEYRRTARKVAHLLVAADAARVRGYGEDLSRFSSCIEPVDVLRLRDLLVNDDPVDLSLKVLNDANIDYSQRNALILLSKVTSNPSLYVQTVSALVERLDNVAIRASGKLQGQWAAEIRSGADSVTIKTGALPRSVTVNHRRRHEGRWVDVASTTVKDPLPVETLAVLQGLDIKLDDLHDG